MSDKIKPSEVSEVLLKELEGINSGEQFDEIGTVLTVADGVARVYGLRNVEASELLEFENGTMAIVMNLEEDNIGCILLGPTSGIKEGETVKRTHRIASIMVNDNFLGRVVNPLGQAIDGLGDIDLTDAFEMPLDRKAPGVIYRQPVKEPLQTGLKAVDSMIPIGRGQRELIIGDRQTGKTAIAIDTILNQKSFYDAGKPVYCIYVAIGQKASTVATLVQTLRIVVLYLIQLLLVQQRLILQPCSIMLLLPVLLLVNISVIADSVRLLYMMICQSRLLHIVRSL